VSNRKDDGDSEEIEIAVYLKRKEMTLSLDGEVLSIDELKLS
jgi:hypothetical protein